MDHVSHETIDKSLFIQSRGVLKKELQQHLRMQRAIRRSKHASLKEHGPGQIMDMVFIRERPASVEDRAAPGYWEGDLTAGSNNSYIATLAERYMRDEMLARVPGKGSETVINALIKHALSLAEKLYKSLTWNRGKEMADPQRFTLATNIKAYFCDPQSPWQRGFDDNTNALLLRQYFPKDADLSVHSQVKLYAVAHRLKERPRKTLERKTPAERFNACVASID